MTRQTAVARKLLAVTLVAGGLITHSLARETADEILAMYYAWKGFADECVGRTPEITSAVHDQIRVSVQAIERAILANRPEHEREQFRQEVLNHASSMLEKMKLQAKPDKDFCGLAPGVLASWSIYTSNLISMMKFRQQLDHGAQ